MIFIKIMNIHTLHFVKETTNIWKVIYTKLESKIKGRLNEIKKKRIFTLYINIRCELKHELGDQHK